MQDSLVHIKELPLQTFSEHEIIELPMTSEDRVRVRRRLRASDGREFALELPTGTVLHVGQAVYADDENVYIVAAAPEDVLVVAPSTLQEAAFAGHLIGNLHRDIDLVDDKVIALWNAPLEKRLVKENLSFERAQQPFKGKPPGEHSH